MMAQGRKRRSGSSTSCRSSTRCWYTPWTSVHLHGSASLPQYDGYASDITYPGQYKDYHYPNFQPARTLWYHDHGVHHTAENVTWAWPGMYHMTTRASGRCRCRRATTTSADHLGPHVQRRRQFLFDTNDQSGMYGDVILVNGVPWPAMKVKRRKYRFRVLNGSVSRAYKYSLSTGDPFTVIGTDGGLMPYPQSVTKMRHIMAERYEIVIDFAKYNRARGSSCRTRTRRTTSAIPTSTRSWRSTSRTRLRPVEQRDPGRALPRQPGDEPAGRASRSTRGVCRSSARTACGRSTASRGTTSSASNFTKVRGNAASRTASRSGSSRTSRAAGSTRCTSTSIDFKILDRNGRPPFAYEKGPKDVVYLGENELVRVIMRFEGSASTWCTATTSSTRTTT